MGRTCVETEEKKQSEGKIEETHLTRSAPARWALLTPENPSGPPPYAAVTMQKQTTAKSGAHLR